MTPHPTLSRRSEPQLRDIAPRARAATVRESTFDDARTVWAQRYMPRQPDDSPFELPGEILSPAEPAPTPAGIGGHSTQQNIK